MWVPENEFPWTYINALMLCTLDNTVLTSGGDNCKVIERPTVQLTATQSDNAAH